MWKTVSARLRGADQELIDMGETWQDTALREFTEESGVSLSSISRNNLIALGTVQQNKHKIVIAFGAYLPDIDPNECHSNMADNGENLEIDRYAWFNFDTLKNITHPTHIGFYEQIIDLLK